MVKINNPLGEVKAGRQGEAVYQRKYGEQIRRTVSPKRAMPSQAQTAHRQLYKEALAWRSGLSRANRRYLEAYCYNNGIVDSYHIPLAWSRFALKLYLKSVKFIVIEKAIKGQEDTLTLHENLTVGTSTGLTCYSNNWVFQTFTPQVGHSISRFGMYLFRTGLPGTLIVSIRNTDGGGKPTGADLCLKTIDGNSLTPDPPGEWRDIIFVAPPPLAQDSKYAMVARALDATAANRVNARYNNTNAYPRGTAGYSSNHGGTWTLYANFDIMFKDWAGSPGFPLTPGLIHVRHPALLTVVHKRGALTVKGFDNLSSLDEEYLTGQVGLDVETGDLIEATTLPGVEYTRQVM